MEILRSFSSLEQGKKRKMRIGFGTSLIVVLTIGVAFAFAAPTNSNKLINAGDASISGNATKSNGGIKFDTVPTTAPTTTHDMSQMTTIPSNPAPSTTYAANLAKLKASPYRNTLEDNSPYKNVASAALPKESLYGPRSAYGNLNAPAGEGIFRMECEFSHFSYDDPIVYPGQPEAAHLHMYFGNTDANAYSTYNSIINTGASTCNGHELNRTSYWAPAVFDGQGNVLTPRRALIYYKSFGKQAGTTVPYPENMQIVAQSTVNVSSNDPNVASFQCENHYGGGDNQKQDTMPNCIGGTAGDGGQMLFEMNIKFPQCYSGKDPDKYIQSLTVPLGHWWSGNCPASHPYALPNLEYRIFYDIKPGDNTSQWFISSDVDRATGAKNSSRGASVHADWFGGWNKEINAMWVKNCNNKPNTDCQDGLLGGSTSDPALKKHAEYPTPAPISGKDLLAKLCTSGKQYTKPTDAAYCR